MKIFLLPYAGGSSLLYKSWTLDSSSGISVQAIEYPGHGFRFKDKMPMTMDEAVDDIVRQIQNGIKKKETADRKLVKDDKYLMAASGKSDISCYVMFGHSMGGLLVWLVTQRMMNRGMPLPEALFLSAVEPPHMLLTDRYRRLQEDEILMGFLRDYNRLPERRLRNPLFIKYLLPVIRNDYRLLSEYRNAASESVNMPMVVFFSKEDTLMRHSVMKDWKGYGSDVRFYELSGDHFYIEDEDTICRMQGVMQGIVQEVL